MRILSALVIAAVLLVGGASSAVSPPAAQAGKLADPIVGRWTSGSLAVEVRQASSTYFQGRWVKATPIEGCTYPAGYQAWLTIFKRAAGYWGFYMYEKPPGCLVAGKQALKAAATWSFVEGGVLRFCTPNWYGTGLNRCVDFTRGAKPPPKPPPKPPSTGNLVVELEEFPERYGLDADRDGLVDQFLTPERINPGVWTAHVKVSRADGSACDPSASYSWQVDGRIAELQPTATKCVFSYDRFKGLGKHRVAVAAALPSGAKEAGAGTIVLRDFLIVGLGDSVGSGEGNPDIGAWGFNPTWVDVRCDRSHNSYQAWTAGWLADVSKRTSVTFVHLACSGAMIDHGLLGGYEGLNASKPNLPGQISQLRELLTESKRTPDAVLLSIGANDLGFGPILGFCITEDKCFAAEGFVRKMPGKTLSQVVAQRLGRLKLLYRTLARAFVLNGIPAGKIYITQYFDPTHNRAGKICTPYLLKVPWLAKLIGESSGTITDVEADWAYDDLITPMNEAVAGAANAFHWNLVPGIAKKFETHGYCAGSRSTWIVQLSQAAMDQGGVSSWVKKHTNWWQDAPFAAAGTMHPNKEGHKAIAQSVLDVLIDHDIDGLMPGA